MREHKIAVVIGGLRRDSYNRQLANALVKLGAIYGHGVSALFPSTKAVSRPPAPPWQAAPQERRVFAPRPCKAPQAERAGRIPVPGRAPSAAPEQNELRVGPSPARSSPGN